MRTSSRRATVVSTVLLLVFTASYVQGQTAHNVASPLVGDVSAQIAPVVSNAQAAQGGGGARGSM